MTDHTMGARTTIILMLLLAGCGSCQRSEEASRRTGAATPAANIGATPLEPAQRQIGSAAPSTPPGGAASATPASPEDGGDCIVVADANPDYGPPPLAVSFSAEAECNTGTPTYRWNFGDESA